MAVDSGNSFDTSRGRLTPIGIQHKFGFNPDIDNAVGTYETIWDGGGAYTGMNAVAAQPIESFSSGAADAGTLLSSGTTTGGTSTTIVDSAATFVTDGGAVGDLVINTTQSDHGIVTAITETTLFVFRMARKTVVAVGDAYKLVTAASTGAAVIRLSHLLNASYVEQAAVYVILNGVTGVDTVESFMRHNRTRVVLAGSGLKNAGLITCRQKTATTNIFGVMAIGFNSSMVCAWTVPANTEAYIESWSAELSNKTAANCTVRLIARPVGEVFQVQEFSTINLSKDLLRTFKQPKGSFMAGTDICVESDSDTNNISVSAEMDITVVPST